MTGFTDKRKKKLWRTIWRVLASMRLAIWLLAALGLLTLVGTLLPQLPAAMDQAARAVWFELARHKYGSSYGLLRSLGLFELFRSPALLALLAALLVNATLCTINRLRALGRMIRKRRITALGSLITHIASIALLLSLAVSHGYAWQESSVALAAGQMHTLGHGKPIDYVAQVTVIKGARPIRSSSVKLNAPLRVGGVGVWLVSYEPAVRVQVRSQEGQALTLESDTGRRSSGQATLSLNSGQALLRVPSMSLELHFSRVTGSETDQAFYLQVLRSGTATPLLAERVQAGQEILIAGVSVILHADRYVIYRLKSDPGAIPALLSALALVVGITLSLFSANERDK